MTYCNHSNQKKYPFILPELPYGKEEFKPHFTAETFDYHYNKHHNAYVTNLNNLLQDKSAPKRKNPPKITLLHLSFFVILHIIPIFIPTLRNELNYIISSINYRRKRLFINLIEL